MQILIHHTGFHSDDTARNLEKWIRNSFNGNFPYNILISKDWEYIEPNPRGSRAWSTMNERINKNSIAVSLVWNFEEEEPTEKQIKTLKQLISEIKQEYRIDGIIGHKDVWNTVCPWKNLYRIIPDLNLNNKNMEERIAKSIVTLLWILWDTTDDEKLRWILSDTADKIREKYDI